MKHKLRKYCGEFTKIASKSLQVITQQGFGTFLLLATEKINRREFKILVPRSYLTVQSGSNALYEFVAYLAERFGCTHIIDVGFGSAKKLTQPYPQFQIINIHFGENLQLRHEQYEVGTSMEWHLEDIGNMVISADMLKRSAIVCADVVEHVGNPTCLLENLRRWLEHAPICILSTPERHLNQTKDQFGRSTNHVNVGKWNLIELKTLLCSEGFNVAFIGLKAKANEGLDCERKEIIAVIEKNTPKNNCVCTTSYGKTTSDFRVVAIMPAYNEEDIIVPSIKHLVDQGIGVYLIDNWSSDATYDLAKQFKSKGLVGIERFPKNGSSKYFDSMGILKRVEELTREIEADWFIYHDIDEVRVSPWLGVSYRDGIYAVDRAGFNSINHTVIMFDPVDNNFVPGSDFETYFKYFEFPKRQTTQIKAWKNLGRPISLVESGGHQVRFNGLRVYPYKFLIKHYRIRSQMHGEKKVFSDRKARWNPREMARGWHIQYDYIKKGHVFLRRASELEFFDDVRFSETYLIERLSGIDAHRQTH